MTGLVTEYDSLHSDDVYSEGIDELQATGLYWLAFLPEYEESHVADTARAAIDWVMNYFNNIEDGEQSITRVGEGHWSVYIASGDQDTDPKALWGSGTVMREDVARAEGYIDEGDIRPG
jgi:hypothetical protein